MLITEQVIKRIGRIFWRGSEYPIWNSEKSEYSCLYVSTDIVYALAYSHPGSYKVETAKYLTQYFLNSRINLFNARFPKDYRKLEDYCRTHENYREFLKLLDKLKDYDWYNEVLGYESRERIIKAIKELNYDGFVNMESKGDYIKRNKPKKYSDTTVYGFDGIGIFDDSFLTINKVYYGWSDIQKISDIQNIREGAAHIINQHLYEICKNKELKIDDDLLKTLNKLTLMVFTYEEIENIVKNFDYKATDKRVKEIREWLRKGHRPIIFAENYI